VTLNLFFLVFHWAFYALGDFLEDIPLLFGRSLDVYVKKVLKQSNSLLVTIDNNLYYYFM